jgi:hypothetical protein
VETAFVLAAVATPARARRSCRSLSVSHAARRSSMSSRVLIAGDDAGFVRALAVVLRSSVREVVTSPSCARVSKFLLESPRDRPIDLLVLDGSERPWVADAVITAVRAAGYAMPIVLIVLGRALGSVDEAGVHVVERSTRVREMRRTIESALRPSPRPDARDDLDCPG